MRYFIGTVLIILFLSSCHRNKEVSSINQVNWEKRKANTADLQDIFHGSSYLPVYSQIYQLNEGKTYDLTVTVSLRNVSQKDTVYILKAEYHNTVGKNIRSYFNNPIYLQPLETVEIVIDEFDKEGGTGGNFIFDWAIHNEKNPPLFEAVMISTTGQQGLSFLTRGVRIYD